jgi:hypothetical protein
MKLADLFNIKYGQKAYTNKESLDGGDVALISSQATDNGCYGFFSIPPKFTPPIITVPRTGSIGWACVQLVSCCVCDDAMVMTPKTGLAREYLFYVAALIRQIKWRFNYGRKITPERLGKFEVVPPEEFRTDISFEKDYNRLYPKLTSPKPLSIHPHSIRKFLITDIFNIERGQFHAIDKLQPGNYTTISRVSTDNGLAGFYDKPKKAKVYSSGIITISTVTGDAFIQLSQFIATDNVLMCLPKREYKQTTLIYIQAAIDNVKWRYSYGRQAYMRIFQKTVIDLPVDKNEEIDEDYIEKIVKNSKYYADYLQRYQNGRGQK